MIIITAKDNCICEKKGDLPTKFKKQTILYNYNNTRSKKLAKRLGFRLETKALGLIENHLDDDGYRMHVC